MQRDKKNWKRSLVVLGLAALVVVACSQPTHEERVAQARSKYEASLNGFVVEQEPVVPTGSETGEAEAGEMAAPAEEAEEMAVPEGGVEGEEGMAPEPVELRQNVLLDIVIRHDSAEKLDGITVDISMADGERELETWKVWFDTSGLDKGPGIQYTHTLEDVDYRPGYGFSAEIRHPVPPEERSEYREFAPAG